MISKTYWRPNISLSPQTVVVVGSGSSGCDVARELASVCPKVYLCVADYERMHAQTVLELPNVVRLSRFEGFDDNGVCSRSSGFSLSLCISTFASVHFPLLLFARRHCARATMACAPGLSVSGSLYFVSAFALCVRFIVPCVLCFISAFVLCIRSSIF